MEIPHPREALWLVWVHCTVIHCNWEEHDKTHDVENIDDAAHDEYGTDFQTLRYTLCHGDKSR